MSDVSRSMAAGCQRTTHVAFTYNSNSAIYFEIAADSLHRIRVLNSVVVLKQRAKNFYHCCLPILQKENININIAVVQQFDRAVFISYLIINAIATKSNSIILFSVNDFNHKTQHRKKSSIDLPARS